MRFLQLILTVLMSLALTGLTPGCNKTEDSAGESEKEESAEGDESKGDESKGDESKGDENSPEAETSAEEGDEGEGGAEEPAAAAEDDTSGEETAAAEATAAEGIPIPEAEQGSGFGVKPVPVEMEPQDNAIFFIMDLKTVVRLGDEGFVEMKKKDFSLFNEIFVGGDGKPYVAGWGVHEVTPDGFEKFLSRKRGDVSANQAALGPEGTVAIIAGLKVKVRPAGDKKWKAFEKDEIGYDSGLGRDLIVDGGGNTWLLHSNGLWVLPAGEEQFKPVWNTLQSAKKKFFDEFLLTPDGKLAFVGGGALYLYDGESLQGYEPEGFATFRGLALLPDGNYALNALNKVMIVDGETMAFTESFEPEKDLGVFHNMTVDGLGRMWIPTEAGLLVVDENLETTRFKPGTLPQISGKVSNIVALGNGPATLPTEGEVARGNIEGVLTNADGSAVAGATIEICPSPKTMFKVSPCAESESMREGKTGDDGSFTFDDVPLNAYGLAVETEKGWSVTFGSSCSGMKEGATCNFGTLELK